MKRKGDTLNTVLGVILAVIGILIFIAGIYKLYQVGASEESENAKKTLDIVIARINAMPEEQAGTFTLQGFSEDAWFLVGWSASDRMRPDKCLLSSCLCICEGSSRSESCQDNGFCREVNFPHVVVESNSLESPTSGATSAGTGAPGVPSGPPRVVVRKCVAVIDSLQEITLFVKKADTVRINGEAQDASSAGSPWVFSSASSCEEKV
jgi:hypothetical protein